MKILKMMIVICGVMGLSTAVARDRQPFGGRMDLPWGSFYKQRPDYPYIYLPLTENGKLTGSGIMYEDLVTLIKVEECAKDIRWCGTGRWHWGVRHIFGLRCTDKCTDIGQKEWEDEEKKFDR